MMAVYNGFCGGYGFRIGLAWLKLTSRKTVHLISLVAGGLGLASFYLIKDPNFLLRFRIRNWTCLGFNSRNALRNSYRITSCRKDGSLHGNF
ncbi:MAG: hypothetical protein MZV64_06255 [Ignavibacteriales bacterium]|nr:hypothetical protein [Ignavibacteriales bacterium]